MRPPANASALASRGGKDAGEAGDGADDDDAGQVALRRRRRFPVSVSSVPCHCVGPGRDAPRSTPAGVARVQPDASM